MYTVTIPGAHGRTTTLTFDTAANAALATQIAAQIASNIAHGTEVAEDSAFGAPPKLPSGERGLWTQSTTGITVLSKGYDDVVSSAPNAVIYGSGDANENVLAGTGNLAFIAGAGSGNIVTGAGTDLITILASDTGNWNMHLGGGNDIVVDFGKGNDTISTGAGHNSIALGAGTYVINTIGNDIVAVGAGNATISASGSTSSSTEVVYGNAGKIDFIGGAGSATIIGGSGSETVKGGAGKLYATGGSNGNNSLTAGTGAATLYGGGSGDTLTAAGSAPQQLHAGAGNETLTGGSATGSDTFFGGAGKDLIIGGKGADSYVAGAGQATVNAVGSSNLFEFIDHQAGGTMVVNDLTNVSQVHIHLAGYPSNAETSAINSQVISGGADTVTLTDNTKITFENITTKLTTSNFS